MKLGITCHPSAGGSGILATELGIALAHRGHQVHFVTTESPFRLLDFHENIFYHSVDSPSYPLFRHPPMSLALTAKICEVAEENGIELWHAHYAVPHAMCAIMARAMLPADKTFKVVTTLHGTDITLVGTDPSFHRITRYSMEQSDMVTSVSNWLTQETLRAFELARPIRTIYNFIDADRFREAQIKRCTFADEDEKIIMHISNFRPVKRVTDVVRVFKKVSDQIPARLIMVGDGPERLSAIGVARQLGITDRIRWLGTNETLEQVLPCADLVFQPSEHESFGLVPLEAMACEVPVLGTRSGGVTEVVEDGETGYLCEVGDIEAMTARALDILTNPELATKMGRKGRERADRLFSKQAIVDEYEALYHELLAVPAVAQ